MTQPTIELKPCPFCGSAGAIHSNGIGDFYVSCNLCEARTDQARCEEPEHAAKRWNTRAALTAKVLPDATLLLRYGGHTKDCDRPRFPECSCGWDYVETLLKASITSSAGAAVKDGAG